MIEMFVRTKHKIDKRHEFALVVINDDALWVRAGMFYYAVYPCNMFSVLLLSHVCVSVVRLHL